MTALRSWRYDGGVGAFGLLERQLNLCSPCRTHEATGTRTLARQQRAQSLDGVDGVDGVGGGGREGGVDSFGGGGRGGGVDSFFESQARWVCTGHERAPLASCTTFLAGFLR